MRNFILIPVLTIAILNSFSSATQRSISRRDGIPGESRISVPTRILTNIPSNNTGTFSCPAGTFECKDKDGGCCPDGTSCLPDAKCGRGDGITGTGGGGTGGDTGGNAGDNQPSNNTCPTGTFKCQDSEGGCCLDGTTCLPNFKCSVPDTGAGGSTPTGGAPNGAGDPGLGGGNGNDTCPVGTFKCQDSEGGCCPDGTTCLPNFKCSAPGTGAGGSTPTGNTPSSVGDGLGGGNGNDTCPVGTFKCQDSEGGCCPDGTTCLPNFKCSAPTGSTGGAGGGITTGNTPNGAGNPGLGGGNGNDTCPAGTFKCQDSEGGCCPDGTTCLPNFKCSAPTGSTGGAGGGTGINNTTAGGDNTNTTTTTGGDSTDNTATTGDDSIYNTSSGNDNTTPTGNGDATPTSSNNAKGDTGSSTSGVYNYKTQLRLSDLFLTIIPVILVHLYV